MRRIEEVNKFELASTIKAFVARALAGEMIEGGMTERQTEAAGIRSLSGVKPTWPDGPETAILTHFDIGAALE